MQSQSLGSALMAVASTRPARASSLDSRSTIPAPAKLDDASDYQLFTTQQVAQLLQISPRSLKRARERQEAGRPFKAPAFIRLGDLPNSPVRYTARAVREFVAKMEVAK